MCIQLEGNKWLTAKMHVVDNFKIIHQQVWNGEREMFPKGPENHYLDEPWAFSYDIQEDEIQLCAATLIVTPG